MKHDLIRFSNNMNYCKRCDITFFDPNGKTPPFTYEKTLPKLSENLECLCVENKKDLEK